MNVEPVHLSSRRRMNKNSKCSIQNTYSFLALKLAYLFFYVLRHCRNLPKKKYVKNNENKTNRQKVKKKKKKRWSTCKGYHVTKTYFFFKNHEKIWIWQKTYLFMYILLRIPGHLLALIVFVFFYLFILFFVLYLPKYFDAFFSICHVKKKEKKGRNQVIDLPLFIRAISYEVHSLATWAESDWAVKTNSISDANARNG